MFGKSKKKNCTKCSEYANQIKINNPEQLSEVILHVKAGVQSGLLTCVEPSKNENVQSFKLVQVQPPWPDLIINKFTCSGCGGHFKLVANTYQGSPKNGWYTSW